MSTNKYIIHSIPNNPNVFKALITGQYSGIEVTITPNFEFGVTNKTPEFLKLNPLGKVPVLESPQGPVFESAAIARHIARVGKHTAELLGKDPYEQTLIDQWTEFVLNYIQPHTFPLIGFHRGFGKYDKETFEKKVKDFEQGFTWLEEHLKSSGKKYIVNDHVTLPDIFLASAAFHPLNVSLDAKFRHKFPKSLAYLSDLYSQPQFKAVLGEVKYIEEFKPPH